MPTSFVLRLVSEALSQRRVIGRVDVVDSGEQGRVQSADDLIEFLYAQAGSSSVIDTGTAKTARNETAAAGWDGAS